MVSVTKRNHIYLETVFQRTENYITCMYVAYRHTEIFSLVKLQWIASVGNIVWAGITLRLCSWQNTILWTAQTWPDEINKQQRMQPQYFICGYAQRFRIVFFAFSEMFWLYGRKVGCTHRHLMCMVVLHIIHFRIKYKNDKESNNLSKKGKVVLSCQMCRLLLSFCISMPHFHDLKSAQCIMGTFQSTLLPFGSI